MKILTHEERQAVLTEAWTTDDITEAYARLEAGLANTNYQRELPGLKDQLTRYGVPGAIRETKVDFERILCIDYLTDEGIKSHDDFRSTIEDLLRQPQYKPVIIALYKQMEDYNEQLSPCLEAV